MKTFVCGKRVRLPDPKDDDAVILYVADWLLLKQQKPALKTVVSEYSTSIVCMYRAANGCACGLGCLIPDNEYEKGFEGEGVQVEVDDPEGANSITEYFKKKGYHTPLLVRLQTVHDLARHQPDACLFTWWQHFVKMSFSLVRDRERSPCRNETSENADSHKDTAFTILNWKIPGIGKDDVRRLAEECQRKR